MQRVKRFALGDRFCDVLGFMVGRESYGIGLMGRSDGSMLFIWRMRHELSGSR
jgi:hypothetical protein